MQQPAGLAHLPKCGKACLLLQAAEMAGGFKPAELPPQFRASPHEHLRKLNHVRKELNGGACIVGWLLSSGYTPPGTAAAQCKYDTSVSSARRPPAAGQVAIQRARPAVQRAAGGLRVLPRVAVPGGGCLPLRACQPSGVGRLGCNVCGCACVLPRKGLPNCPQGCPPITRAVHMRQGPHPHISRLPLLPHRAHSCLWAPPCSRRG